MRIRNRAMNRGMDDEARAVHRPGGLAQRIALDIDEQKARRRDLAVVQAERIDQEARLRAWHAQRDVVEDELVPAEHVEDAIGGGELDAQRLLLLRHRQLFYGTSGGLIDAGHGLLRASHSRGVQSSPETVSR